MRGRCVWCVSRMWAMGRQWRKSKRCGGRWGCGRGGRCGGRFRVRRPRGMNWWRGGAPGRGSEMFGGAYYIWIMAGFFLLAVVVIGGMMLLLWIGHQIEKKETGARHGFLEL